MKTIFTMSKKALCFYLLLFICSLQPLLAQDYGIIGSFRTNLYLLYDNDSTWIADGNIAQFNDKFSAGIDYQDAFKFNNILETFSIQDNNVSLAADRRPWLVANDTIFFKLTKMRERKYQFKFEPLYLSSALVPWLMDSYTNKPVLLSATKNTSVNFEANSSTASKAANRFYVVFKPMQVTYCNIKAYPQNNITLINWRVQNEAGVKNYAVEKATDTLHFATAATILLKQGDALSSSYAFEDATATAGITYYRIKNYNKDGSTGFSKIVPVTIEGIAAGTSIYPNPITGKAVTLQLKYMPAGRYAVKVINSFGQVLALTNIEHGGGSASQKILTGNGLAAGIYTIEVTRPDKTKRSINVVVL